MDLFYGHGASLAVQNHVLVFPVKIDKLFFIRAKYLYKEMCKMIYFREFLYFLAWFIALASQILDPKILKKYEIQRFPTRNGQLKIMSK